MLRSLAVRFALVAVLCAACSHDATRSNETPGPSAADHAAVRSWLASHRARQIERLDAYARAGAFPHNYAQPIAAHVFRDEAGRLCAVANLVHQDGRDDLVRATARDRNDLAIADVRDGALFDWVLASGLTQEELARIQLPAPPLARRVAPSPPRPAPVAQSPDLVARGDADDELRMKAAVREHLATVARELRANAEASLRIASDRFDAPRDPPAEAPAVLAANGR
ncbi:MAG TPA: hypothetical protein VKU41_13560 [Polyangiaceae bacterium]|nr:hypothetical protein [Polyangiaceae bacterium]